MKSKKSILTTCITAFLLGIAILPSVQAQSTFDLKLEQVTSGSKHHFFGLESDPCASSGARY